MPLQFTCVPVEEMPWSLLLLEREIKMAWFDLLMASLPVPWDHSFLVYDQRKKLQVLSGHDHGQKAGGRCRMELESVNRGGQDSMWLRNLTRCQPSKLQRATARMARVNVIPGLKSTEKKLDLVRTSYIPCIDFYVVEYLWIN